MIRILQKFFPFSRRPGTRVWIPKSSFFAEIFPTRIVIFQEGKREEIDLPLKGPIQDFLVTLDLERDRVTLSGKSGDKPFQYSIFKRETTIFLKKDKEERPLMDDTFSLEGTSKEKLFLGVTKKQDIDLMERRFDSHEIFPILFYLGQKVSPMAFDFPLPKTESDIALFVQAHLTSLFFPMRKDLFFLGLETEEIPEKTPLVSLYRALYEAIRSLFVHEEGKRVYLHPPFHAGSMISLECSFGLLDMQWKGGKLYKAILHPEKEGRVTLILPQEIKSFRIKERLFERGVKVNNGCEFSLTGNKRLFLDKFQK